MCVCVRMSVCDSPNHRLTGNEKGARKIYSPAFHLADMSQWSVRKQISVHLFRVLQDNVCVSLHFWEAATYEYNAIYCVMKTYVHRENTSTVHTTSLSCICYPIFCSNLVLFSTFAFFHFSLSPCPSHAPPGKATQFLLLPSYCFAEIPLSHISTLGYTEN